jgi:hypothetical protein
VRTLERVVPQALPQLVVRHEGLDGVVPLRDGCQVHQRLRQPHLQENRMNSETSGCLGLSHQVFQWGLHAQQLLQAIFSSYYHSDVSLLSIGRSSQH